MNWRGVLRKAGYRPQAVEGVRSGIKRAVKAWSVAAAGPESERYELEPEWISPEPAGYEPEAAEPEPEGDEPESLA